MLHHYSIFLWASNVHHHRQIVVNVLYFPYSDCQIAYVFVTLELYEKNVFSFAFRLDQKECQKPYNKPRRTLKWMR